MMKDRIFSKLVLIAFSLAIMAAPIFCEPYATSVSASDKPIELRFAWYQAATMSESVALEKYVDEVEKRTNGKVKITTYPGGTLADARGLMDAVGQGTCDIAESIAAYTPGRVPLQSGLELPYGFDSSLMASRISWEAIKKHCVDEFKAQGIHLLFVWTTLPTCIQSKVPVRKLEDLKGVEIRCPSSQVGIYKALGAVPVSMPITESYMALQKGVVDAQSLPLDSAAEWGMADVTKYWTDANICVTVLWVGMNINTWQSLPSDVKKVFDGLDTFGLELLARTWDNNLPKALEKAKAKEIELIKLAPEERKRWEARYLAVREAWIKEMEAKGLQGSALVNDVVKLVSEYSKTQK